MRSLCVGEAMIELSIAPDCNVAGDILNSVTNPSVEVVTAVVLRFMRDHEIDMRWIVRDAERTSGLYVPALSTAHRVARELVGHKSAIAAGVRWRKTQ